MKKLCSSCDHFGACPDCGQVDDCLNIGRDHWLVCHLCRTRWRVGSNLFDAWREEDLGEHTENYLALLGYREVAPLDAEPGALCESCATAGVQPPDWQRALTFKSGPARWQPPGPWHRRSELRCGIRLPGPAGQTLTPITQWPIGR